MNRDKHLGIALLAGAVLAVVILAALQPLVGQEQVEPTRESYPAGILSAGVDDARDIINTHRERIDTILSYTAVFEYKKVSEGVVDYRRVSYFSVENSQNYEIVRMYKNNRTHERRWISANSGSVSTAGISVPENFSSGDILQNQLRQLPVNPRTASGVEFILSRDPTYITKKQESLTVVNIIGPFKTEFRHDYVRNEWDRGVVHVTEQGLITHMTLRYNAPDGYTELSIEFHRGDNSLFSD